MVFVNYEFYGLFDIYLFNILFVMYIIIFYIFMIFKNLLFIIYIRDLIDDMWVIEGVEI